MRSDKIELGGLITGMRQAYARGENAMAWAKANSKKHKNTVFSTLVAYDLQAGTYVEYAKKNSEFTNKWCGEIASLLKPYIEPDDHLLEIGVGEATTLVGTIKSLGEPSIVAFGLDISWSRIKVAQRWAAENSAKANFFVGNLFQIPLADNSVDIIYTSHSLEPNGGNELSAITELLRVARKAVVLVEPIYELADKESQERMTEHGYVRGLKSTAEMFDVRIEKYELLNITANPKNPSGVVAIKKNHQLPKKHIKSGEASWQCPVTGSPLLDKGNYFYSGQVGLAYPVLCEVPLLRSEHVVVASRLGS